MQSPSRRQRSRKACQPCRQRKRKCDGNSPCSTCVRYEYDCHFSTIENSNSANSPPDRDVPAGTAATQSGSGTQSSHPPSHGNRHHHPAVLEPHKTRFMQANSSVAFPRLLGLELNSSCNALRLHSFAWNLGVRPEPRFERPDLTDYISFGQFEVLRTVYFSVIHPIYHFLDPVTFAERCQRRFSTDTGTDAATAPTTDRRIDPVLLGVAALGSLFLYGDEASSVNEASLVDLARTTLEHTSTMINPTLDQVAAWILRTIYLRCTTRPHASWLASCTTMHLVEATGLHQDVSKIAFLTSAPPELSPDELHLRRRLFWTAHALNKTLSHEYGRSCARLVNANVDGILNPDDEPALRDQYLTLANLLPGDDVSPFDDEGQHILHEAVSDLARLRFTSDAMLLFRADLAFSIYRKKRLAQRRSSPGISPSPTSSSTTTIIQLGLDALPASTALAARHLPWWTVISVPFQFVCILLAIDSREALATLPAAMAVLEDVGRCWDTHMVREAMRAAALLVKLSWRRKEEDVQVLGRVVQKYQQWTGGDAIVASGGGENGTTTTTAEQGGAGRIRGETPRTATATGRANGEVGVGFGALPTTTTTTTGLDFIDGFGGLAPLPDDFSLDWNTFFNTMDWL